ncbi:DUF3800 domain-containing protein [Amycolatopsis vancoresmycina]|uniref:NAD-dependent protein deacetylase of SIR2 family n=1 Tax=Amycolatopsis vancoresmycina DSM 44592 TaxID=1292037 RepID=R1HUZ0_9PSEU|nr:DUF3800 domain-containing protein [Amycolatopsis vancoresmycina]EOD67365.1 hypothetical protein H480_16860 [Amycolatopsis vancoresmycina DSM 44592]
MRPVEIACDESGSEGENLLGGETAVFAHAGVRMPPAEAAACVREIRARIGSPAEEYKANHLLRAKHRAVLEWLLAPDGPLDGRGHVHLTGKTFFAVRAMVTLLAEDGTEEMARVLHRTGPAAFGAARWAYFLTAFTSIARLRPRRGVTASPEEFFALAGELAQVPGEAGDLIGRLRGGAGRVTAYRRRLASDPGLVPALDPLVPAVIHTVRHWSADGTPVELVHDEQLALTAERILQLKSTLGHRLAGVRFVDSRADARVQMADFLAGVARRIASDELDGRGDPGLTALLRSFVDDESVWDGPGEAFVGT